MYKMKIVFEFSREAELIRCTFVEREILILRNCLMWLAVVEAGQFKICRAGQQTRDSGRVNASASVQRQSEAELSFLGEGASQLIGWYVFT